MRRLVTSDGVIMFVIIFFASRGKPYLLNFGDLASEGAVGDVDDGADLDSLGESAV